MTTGTTGLTESVKRLLPHGWKILSLSLAAGIATVLLLFLVPDSFQASATLSPVKDEMKKNPALGALSSFGINLGGPAELEDLDALFKSRDLTARVFGKNDLWKRYFAGGLDPQGRMKVGLKDKVVGTLLGRNTDPAPPGDWDAIRMAKNRLEVSSNKKTGLLTVSFEAPTKEASADIVRCYLEEGKNCLQEEALNRAGKNKGFIEAQIGKTVDPLTRDRLYQLLGQETEREMLARNREQFGFRIVDAPRVPDRKAGPKRALSGMLAAAVTFLGACLFYLKRGNP